jgi:lysophospholipase L1-like esterase
MTAAVLLLAGCAHPAAASAGAASVTSSATSSSGATHTGPYSIVALGDSVPAGTACNCKPYPELSAALLSVPHGRQVVAANDAVGGATSTDVLHDVTTNRRVENDLETADIVELEVGANDVGFSDTCGTDVSCYQPTLSTIDQNLRDIAAQVHTLAQGHPVLIVFLDYWSVWLGGAYAEAQGQAYVDAATSLTEQTNTVIHQVAVATGSVYVDLRAAFKGPNYAYDETHFLASDGDHPNALGHAQIARAVTDVVTETLHL